MQCVCIGKPSKIPSNLNLFVIKSLLWIMSMVDASQVCISCSTTSSAMSSNVSNSYVLFKTNLARCVPAVLNGHYSKARCIKEKSQPLLFYARALNKPTYKNHTVPVYFQSVVQHLGNRSLNCLDCQTSATLQSHTLTS